MAASWWPRRASRSLGAGGHLRSIAVAATASAATAAPPTTTGGLGAVGRLGRLTLGRLIGRRTVLALVVLLAVVLALDGRFGGCLLYTSRCV